MAVEETFNKGIKEVAEELGAVISMRLKEGLEEKGKEASGTLVSSIRAEAKFDGEKAVVEIYAEDYFRYVEFGRKPGKFPPLEAIKQWTRIKGIGEEFAFPIARKIATQGIQPLNILNDVIDKATEEFRPKYERALEKIAGAVLVNDVFNKTNTKGQMIPKSLTQS